MSTKQNQQGTVNPFEYYTNPTVFNYVDRWIPMPHQRIFKTVKNSIILPVSKFFGIHDNLALDSFNLTAKRCYSNYEIRSHICQYLNYFENYFDQDHELLLYYYRIKYMIDYGIVDRDGNIIEYTQDDFLKDLYKYILGDSIYQKIKNMNEVNYTLNLVYKNKTNIGLQYNNVHGNYFMEMSLLMNMLIPLITHFIYKKKIVSGIEQFFLNIYHSLFDKYKDVDLYNKLYETTNTTINKDANANRDLWNMSSIRGCDPVVNSFDVVDIIIMQVIPKYKYSENIIMYNFGSIKKSLKYTVTDISYEFDFISLSSSKRDGEDNTSQFDKFEAHLIKSDESKYLQNKFNSERTMEFIRNKYGPFSDEEIDFYLSELMKSGKLVMNNFQKRLIFNLFYKLFGDSISINSINIRDYVVLMIAAKRILISSGMVVLPYIISSKVIKLITRNTINKKEMMKLEASEYYNIVQQKYNNPKIEKQILSNIAVILSSEFEVIDYNNRELNGTKLSIFPEYLIEEMLMYVSLI